MNRLVSLLGSLALLISGSWAEATPTAGSCAGYNFPLNSSGDIDTNVPMRVLRHDAPVYEDIDGSRQSAVRLKFGTGLLPVQTSTPRRMIQVRTFGAGVSTPLGWMAEHDLLCAYTPLLSDKGLERKVFIKTPPSTDPSFATVDAYASYQDRSCEDRCKPLSRFQLYFIFAEDPDNKRYLVSDIYNLAQDSLPPLVGWVDSEKSIRWDTALGVCRTFTRHVLSSQAKRAVW
jgi:hypothetical protein